MTRVEHKLPLKAFAALMVVYLVWGTTMGAMHFGVETIPPALLACSRFIIAGVIMLLVCRLQGERWPSRSEWRFHALVGFLLFFGGNALSGWALQYISTGLGGMIIATTPFWMIGLSALTQSPDKPREKIQPGILVAFGLGFLGMAVLLSPQLLSPVNVTPLFWLSILALLVMCFFWSAGSLVARRQASGQSIFMSLGAQNLAAGLMLLPVCWATGSFENVTPSLSSLTGLVYLIFFGTILTTPCYYYVLNTLPVSVASTFAYVNPVITVLFGWWFLGESLLNTTLAGSALIVAAVVLVQWLSRPSAKREPVSPELSGRFVSVSSAAEPAELSPCCSVSSKGEPSA